MSAVGEGLGGVWRKLTCGRSLEGRPYAWHRPSWRVIPIDVAAALAPGMTTVPCSDGGVYMGPNLYFDNSANAAALIAGV